jgi:hypothetical protein
MVAMSAPVACSRFSRVSSLPPASNLHAFHVSNFMDGDFSNCSSSVSLRSSPGSCRT